MRLIKKMAQKALSVDADGTEFAYLKFKKEPEKRRRFTISTDNTQVHLIKLRSENIKLTAENLALKKQVTAMQSRHLQLSEHQAEMDAIYKGIIGLLQEKLSGFPLVSGAYCALNQRINEVSINVVMDSLDYDTEKELIGLFINIEDRFPVVRLKARLPVLPIEEANMIYSKQGSDLCYKRAK